MTDDPNDDRCGSWLKQSFAKMNELKTGTTAWGEFNDVYMPCDNITSADGMEKAWKSLQSGLEYMAMINYPYKTDFLEPVPANPISFACDMAYNSSDWSDTSATKTEQELWAQMKIVTDVYFNYTG